MDIYGVLRTENRALKLKLLKYESSDFTQNLEKEYYRKLEATERKYKSEIRKLKREHEKEIKELQEAHKQEIKAIHEELAEEKEAVRKKHKEDQKLIRQLEKDLKKLSQEKDEAIEGWMQEHLTKRSLEKDNQKLMADNERLKGENSNLRTENRQLREESAKKDDEIKKLKITINKDFNNSSKPSSMTPNHKTIHNSRVKSGKKPGGQKGHKGARRPVFIPDDIIMLDEPEEVRNNPDDYVLEKEVKKRTMVGIEIVQHVTEYQSRVWRNVKTGKKIFSRFPSNCSNETNYDESIKAFVCLLMCSSNTSIRKSVKFLSDVSGGRIRISTGMADHLKKEFVKKSEAEKQEIWKTLLSSTFMHMDATYTRIEGKTGYIGVNTSPSATWYSAGSKKGFELFKDMPASEYLGIAIHDGEATFNSYGTFHQQCLTHILRYLASSIENEPDLSWARQMREWIHKAMKQWKTDPKLTPEDIASFEKEYVAILKAGLKEYKDRPLHGFKEGINTCKRMLEDKDDFLLFLRRPELPMTNNPAEQKAREMKRKTKQSDGFRSLE